MLDLEVIPERSLGCDNYEFVLGMHFSQAVAIIQSQVGVIKGVQVLYCDMDPLSVDLVINLPQDGIRLIFDPVVQRLKIIEICNMKLIKLRYCGMYFNSPEVLPSIEQIENSFGATHPGVYDADKQLFVLNFRGLSFYFTIDSKFQPTYAHGLGSLQFANGVSPLVTRTAIYTGNQVKDCTPPELPISCYNKDVYLDRLDVIRDRQQTKGIQMYLFTEGTSRSLEPCKLSMMREVNFGQSCQSVIAELGAPSRVFYKSEDKMKIHKPGVNRYPSQRRSDYFFNYFTLGIDILFDARSHRVKKFVLHTNYPGHYNFNSYHRCEFNITLTSSIVGRVNGKTSNCSYDACQNDRANHSDNKLVDKDISKQGIVNSCESMVTTTNLIELSPTPVLINAYTKWDQICEQLKPSIRPVVLNRASSTNTTNPFGSTFCYGYQDIIFEVMSNNHIASIMMYNTAHHQNELLSDGAIMLSSVPVSDDVEGRVSSLQLQNTASPHAISPPSGAAIFNAAAIFNSNTTNATTVTNHVVSS